MRELMRKEIKLAASPISFIFIFLPQQMEPGNGGETISPPFRPDGNEEDDSSLVLYPQKQIQITIQ